MNPENIYILKIKDSNRYSSTYISKNLTIVIDQMFLNDIRNNDIYICIENSETVHLQNQSFEDVKKYIGNFNTTFKQITMETRPQNNPRGLKITRLFTIEKIELTEDLCFKLN